MPDPKRLLTKEQLAQKLNVSPATVAVWGRTGRIPQLRLGWKTVRYVWRDVLAALRAVGDCAGCGTSLKAENIGGFDQRERAYCLACAMPGKREGGGL